MVERIGIPANCHKYCVWFFYLFNMSINLAFLSVSPCEESGEWTGVCFQSNIGVQG